MPYRSKTLATVVAVLAAAVLAGPAHARTFTVDSTADQSDQNAGDGICNTSDLECTLRAAVEEANAFARDPSDTIVVPAGTYDLFSAISPATDMQIAGASARTTVVNQAGTDRVFEIAPVGPSPTVGISEITLSNGVANAKNGSFGGNLLAQDSTVTLTNIKVIGGTGDSGGGLSNVRGTMTVRNSTITGNSAPTDPIEGGDAGAILNFGDTSAAATLTVQNSTITGNTARLGAGILSRGAANVVTVANSTIVGNGPTANPRLDQPNGGGLTVINGSATVSGSIIANNTSPAPATPNCASDPAGQFGPPPGTIGSAGGNVESGTDCGFTASGDLQSRDPEVGALANNGGPTDTHALSPTSPARDRAGTANCPSTDQRGAPRPQGSGCDSGAFEFSVFPAATTGGATAVGTAKATVNGVGRPEGQPTAFRFQFGETTAYGSNVPASGGPLSAGSQAVSATLAGLESGTTYHYRLTAASPAGSAIGADRTFTTLKTIEDLPPPTLGKTTNVEPVSGVVLVALPPKATPAGAATLAQKGLRFIPLTEARQIPVGSMLDTKRGRVRLQTARTRRGQRQSGQFFSGLFQVLQSRSRSAKGLTELRLKGSSFRSCQTRRRGRRATASASRRIRRLGSNARGRFRTRGRHSAATVRGTKWTTTDRCDGTLTTVQRGSVAVRDFRRKKTIVVKAGKSYLAKARP